MSYPISIPTYPFFPPLLHHIIVWMNLSNLEPKKSLDNSPHQDGQNHQTEIHNPLHEAKVQTFRHFHRLSNLIIICLPPHCTCHGQTKEQVLCRAYQVQIGRGNVQCLGDLRCKASLVFAVAHCK